MHATAGDTITLTRFVPGPRVYDEIVHALDADPDRRLGMLVDAETTGKDPLTCALTELACVRFLYHRVTREILEVLQGESWYNDPKVPIPAEVVALNGITDEMVKGKSIDRPRVETLIDESALVISHHADFDRRVLERTATPAFARVNWACSYKDVDWRGRFGARCAVLEHLIRDVTLQFYDAHHAADDCYAALHMLATARADDGRFAFDHLLESARKPTWRVWCLDSHFLHKEILKDHDFEWSNGHEGKRKGWYFDGDEAQAKAVFAWLKDQPFLHKRDVEIVSRRDRFSVREDTEQTNPPSRRRASA